MGWTDERHPREIEVPVGPGPGIGFPPDDMGIQETIRLQGASWQKEQKAKNHEDVFFQEGLLLHTPIVRGTSHFTARSPCSSPPAIAPTPRSLGGAFMNP